MSMRQQFSTDKSLESGGVVLDYGSFIITIARAGGGNKKFTTTMEKLSKPYRRAIQTESMDNKRAEALLHEAYAEAIVIDWHTQTGEDADGERLMSKGIEPAEFSGEYPTEEELVPFNKENTIKIFKELPDLFQDIQEQSSKMALFRKSVQEVESKNS